MEFFKQRILAHTHTIVNNLEMQIEIITKCMNECVAGGLLVRKTFFFA